MTKTPAKLPYDTLVKSLYSPCFRAVARVIETVGKHPLAVLALPSLWLLGQFLPFWKDVDAVHQLLAPPWAGNILHFPPLYCFLGRLPFWLTDKLTLGDAPGIFGEQRPSLLAARCLIFSQHIALWAALRYFLFSLALSDRSRGLAALLLASVASFYTFAHTAGSEAVTPITWFLIFGAGIRVVSGGASWRTWIIYAAALLLAIGSRKLNGVLLLWLPGVMCIWCLAPRFFRRDRVPDLRGMAKVTGLAIAISLGASGMEKGLVTSLCQRFGVIERSTDGSTFSDRISTLVHQLSPAEKDWALAAVTALTNDENVRLAIGSQLTLGAYHEGTDKVIGRALALQGWDGEALQAEKDRVILAATLCFYRTLHVRLSAVILKEFVRGWAPTSDHRVARSGPFATFLFARHLADVPADGSRLPKWPMFQLETARRTLARADRDPFISHWQGIPILAWLIAFALLGLYRLRKQRLTPRFFLLALSMLAVGAAAYFGACVFAYSTPRYTLPLVVAVFAFGCTCLASHPTRMTSRSASFPPSNERRTQAPPGWP